MIAKFFSSLEDNMIDLYQGRTGVYGFFLTLAYLVIRFVAGLNFIGGMSTNLDTIYRIVTTLGIAAAWALIYAESDDEKHVEGLFVGLPMILANTLPLEWYPIICLGVFLFLWRSNAAQLKADREKRAKEKEEERLQKQQENLAKEKAAASASQQTQRPAPQSP